MAWTTPRTWTDGELVTAAIMNAHVRDNLAVVPHLLCRSTANQDVVASTTLVNATSMSFSVAASDVWQANWNLLTNSAAAGDFKYAFTFPTGGVMDFYTVTTSAAGTLQQTVVHATSSPSGTGVIEGAGAAVGPVLISFLFVNSTNAGTIQLQIAQVAASGTSTLLANSHAIGMKIN